MSRNLELLTAIRKWFNAHPNLKDRLRPMLRNIGYAQPVHRELKKYLEHAVSYRAIQLGAHDGVTHDPCREYFIRPGWRAIVVEPNPTIFNLLTDNYREYSNVHPVNAAASYSATELMLWRFEEALLADRADARILSTLVSSRRENMAQFVGPNDEAMNHLEYFTVPTVTVEQLADRFGFDRVDGLFLDVEGHEQEILLNVDYDKLGVKLVLFENHLLPDRGAVVKAHLGQLGFGTIEIGVDSLAVR